MSSSIIQIDDMRSDLMRRIRLRFLMSFCSSFQRSHHFASQRFKHTRAARQSPAEEEEVRGLCFCTSIFLLMLFQSQVYSPVVAVCTDADSPVFVFLLQPSKKKLQPAAKKQSYEIQVGVSSTLHDVCVKLIRVEFIICRFLPAAVTSPVFTNWFYSYSFY